MNTSKWDHFWGLFKLFVLSPDRHIAFNDIKVGILDNQLRIREATVTAHRLPERTTNLLTKWCSTAV